MGTRRDIPERVNSAWDDAKNEKLRKERGIGSEDVVFHIEDGDVLDTWAKTKPKDGA